MDEIHKDKQMLHTKAKESLKQVRDSQKVIKSLTEENSELKKLLTES